MDNGISGKLREALPTHEMRRLTDAGEWAESDTPMIEDIIVAFATKAVRWQYYLAAAGMTRRRIICVTPTETLSLKLSGKAKKK